MSKLFLLKLGAHTYENIEQISQIANKNKDIYNQLDIFMMNLCGMFTGVAQPGEYAYEAFKQIQLPQGLQNLYDGINAIRNPGNNPGGALGGIMGVVSSIGGIMRPQNNNNFLPNSLNPNTALNPSSLADLVQNMPFQSGRANNSTLTKLQELDSAVIKKIKKSNYTKLVQEYREKGGKWTDPDFPPDQSSIGRCDQIQGRVTWRRIPDIIPNPEFVSGSIEPADVIQGSVGNCYFLSALASLAQRDYRIKNCFPNLNINPNGIYMVRVLFQGVLRQVVVDDFIPCNQRGQPLFAKPAGGNEVWVMIMEKAWAKLHGSYGATIGGLPNEVLTAFSGAPTTYYGIGEKREDDEQVWKKMMQGSRKGSLMCTGTKDDPAVEKSGLVLGHAYTVLGVYESPYRMVKLRNPWGKREWNGRASDQDQGFWSRVAPQVKQQLGYQPNNDDGVFFMFWEDLVNYFDMMDICGIDDNAAYLNEEATFSAKNGKYFDFTTDGGPTTITISQNSLREFSAEVQKQGLARTTLVISRYEKAQKGYEYKYVASKSSSLLANNSIDLGILSAGEYVMFAKCDWIRQDPDTASVSVYTRSRASLKVSSVGSGDKFLYKTFLDHARKNPKKKVLSESPEEWITSDFLIGDGGYGYLAVHLDEKSQRKLGIQFDESEFTQKRLVLKRPYKGSGKIKAIVEPGKELIILYRMKARKYPTQLTLPTPKIFNLV